MKPGQVAMQLARRWDRFIHQVIYRNWSRLAVTVYLQQVVTKLSERININCPFFRNQKQSRVESSRQKQNYIIFYQLGLYMNLITYVSTVIIRCTRIELNTCRMYSTADWLRLHNCTDSDQCQACRYYRYMIRFFPYYISSIHIGLRCDEKSVPSDCCIPDHINFCSSFLTYCQTKSPF